MGGGIRQKQDLPPDAAPSARPLPRDWPCGGEPITLTLTANAGILVDYRGEKLLVDGLHTSTAHSFSPVPAALLEAIIAGRGVFADIHFLLFTHLHLDHFSGDAVRRFLEHNAVARLFLPIGNGGAGIDPGINALRAYLMAQGTPVQELDLPLGRMARYPLSEGMWLSAFAAPHAGEDYEDTPHNCFLLSAGHKNLLFLGDSDYDKDYFSAVIGGIPVDTAVVNPLFLNKSAGRDALLYGVRPARIVVNHLPFAEEDALRFRAMLVRDLARHGDALPPIAVLWDALDSVVL